MATDWLSLFDKRLCNQILALDAGNLLDFVESHLSALHNLSEFKCGFSPSVSASARVKQLRDAGRTDEELKADLVDHLCVSADRLMLDYWGCYAEVFRSGDPPGSIPDYTLFPHIKQQGYLLLRPEHVEEMLASLEEHRLELRVMEAPQLGRLREWKNLCKEDPGQMVAYFYDT